MLGAPDRRQVAGSSARVPKPGHLPSLACPVRPGWNMEADVAGGPWADGCPGRHRLGRVLHRRDLQFRQKGGDKIGPTKRGKGTKIMVIADGHGTPTGIQTTSASPAEVKLAESTLATVRVPRVKGGRPRNKPLRLIGDRAYDSDPLRYRLAKRGIVLIVPHRRNRTRTPPQDGRVLRRYKKRWKIERTNAWLQNFRRIQVRYDRILTVFQGFLHFACLLIALSHLCN